MAGLVPAIHVLLSAACEAAGLFHRQLAHRPRFYRSIASVMAGLVPAIHVLFNAACGAAFVYFITNRRNGILYVGVTSNLARRAHEHREGLVPGFSKRYGLTMLVYCEYFDDIRYAIQREKTIKHWRARGRCA